MRWKTSSSSATPQCPSFTYLNPLLHVMIHSGALAAHSNVRWRFMNIWNFHTNMKSPHMTTKCNPVTYRICYTEMRDFRFTSIWEILQSPYLFSWTLEWFFLSSHSWPSECCLLLLFQISWLQILHHRHCNSHRCQSLHLKKQNWPVSFTKRCHLFWEVIHSVK